MQKYFKAIASHLNIRQNQVEAVASLLDEGATVPFISRYRKEATGALDEVAVHEIEVWYKRYTELEKRKQTILETIAEQGKLTDELKAKIENTLDSTELEDLYLPYKPKKRTRATIAKELGLEPLAAWIMKQWPGNPEQMAEKYIKEGVEDIDKALQGARDIIAEWVNEDAVARQRVRNYYNREALVISKIIKGKEAEGIKYEDYYDFSEPLKKCPSHRMLAIRRGEEEGFLRVVVEPEGEEVELMLEKHFANTNYPASQQVKMAVADSYKRLIQPSIENEFKKLSKEKADKEAIEVFARNLRQLLLASPLGQKRILALDPGFRTGCKVVCLDAMGTLLHNEAIYPHPPQNEWSQAQKKILTLVKSL